MFRATTEAGLYLVRAASKAGLYLVLGRDVHGTCTSSTASTKAITYLTYLAHTVQIDRLFDWKAQTDAPIQQTLNSQKDHVKREFDERLKQSVLNLNEQGLNVALYWQNPDKRKYVNVVPTSAITGEGLPDMLQLLVDLTQVRHRHSPPSAPP